MTAVAGAVFTASNWNIHLRDNLLETEVAKASAYGQTFSGTGQNSIAARQVSQATNSGVTILNNVPAYSDLASVGPVVTVDTGVMALVMSSCRFVYQTSSGWYGYMSYAVSGATTRIAADGGAVGWRSTTSDQMRMTGVDLCQGLTPGTNTFTAKYRADGGPIQFQERTLTVWPF